MSADFKLWWRRGLLLTTGLAVIALIMACSSSTEPEPPPTPAGDQIASFGSKPVCSPDGEKILFGGDGADAGLWVYNISSGALEQITDENYPHLFDYCWSPNSDEIAFGGAGAVVDEKSGIFTVALDGSDPVRWHATGYSPNYAPDGGGLVFAEEDAQAAAYGIRVLVFADTSITVLTNTGTDPEYNNNGTMIAYRDPGASLAVPLRTVPAAGGAAITLADTCLSFVWTDDGNYLIYDYMKYDQDDSGMRICRVLSAGGVPEKIVSSASQPSITPDDLIAYQKVEGDLSKGIYRVNFDGGSNSGLTSEGFQPSIAPDGSVVVFARDDGIWMIGL